MTWADQRLGDFDTPTNTDEPTDHGNDLLLKLTLWSQPHPPDGSTWSTNAWWQARSELGEASFDSQRMTTLTQLDLSSCANLKNLDRQRTLRNITSLNLPSCASLEKNDGLANFHELTQLRMVAVWFIGECRWSDQPSKPRSTRPQRVLLTPEH